MNAPLVPVTIKLLMESVGKRTRSFFKDEFDLQCRFEHHDEHAQRVQLRFLTSVVSISGPLNLLIAFSFDESLMRLVFERYTQEIDIEPDEEAMYMEETAGDVINIIIGNIFSDFDAQKEPFYLSPPIIITEAKTILRHKGAAFSMLTIETQKGTLWVYFIAPRELFDQTLNYTEA